MALTSAEARRFLLTGLVQYEVYDAMDNMLLDASPGIIPLASALELEVNRRLLDAFRGWLAEQGIAPAATGPLKPFAAAVAPNSSISLELGRIGYYLSLIAKNRGGSAPSISQAFAAFCQSA